MFFPEEKLEKTKQFVKKHQTAVACVATGVITWKFGRRAGYTAAIDGMAPTMDEIVRAEQHLMLQNRVMLDFINLKDLGEELQKHILSMKQ